MIKDMHSDGDQVIISYIVNIDKKKTNSLVLR